MKPYGKELILDLHECDSSTFTRKSIKKYFIKMCELIDMERCKLCWWDYEGHPEEYKKAEAHLKGISAVQFISTSDIRIHTLDEMKRVYLNIFTCKDFAVYKAMDFTKDYFKGRIINQTVVDRI